MMAMPPLPRSVALLLATAVSCLAGAPAAAADPRGGERGSQSASAVIDDLRAQGYDVQINWLAGYGIEPLTDCRVTGVNNPGNLAPDEDSSTTVYVDVVCPDEDDAGFKFGVGIGFG